MKQHRCRTLVLAGLCAVAWTASAGTVNVVGDNTSRFTDAGTGSAETDATVRALAAHLQRLGERLLPADHVLKVELLDVDLAGTVHPSRAAGRDLRIVRGGADVPHIRLRYALEAPGRPPLSGEETVTDLNYSRGLAASPATDALHAEKRMLDAWFKSRLVERKEAAR